MWPTVSYSPEMTGARDRTDKLGVGRQGQYAVNPGWRVMLRDLGLNPHDVLRRAELPDDLFSRVGAWLTTDAYFRLWRGIEEEADDPALPIRLGSGISVEAFDAPVFAALCSADLNGALQRIAHYKRLVMPMRLHVEVTSSRSTLTFEWLDTNADPPASLVAAELVFFVQLARIATRTRVVPLDVTACAVPEPAAAYVDYFGCAVRQGERPQITYAAQDAVRPFLTSNQAMWQYFEPELRRRLSELDAVATIAERVRGALLELLPAGGSSVEAVSKRLGIGVRTLQRRLKEEGQTFQGVVNRTRESLATHYLKSSTMSGAEISFLLGFEDPNSFFRAFQAWTGTTPERVRRQDA